MGTLGLAGHRPRLARPVRLAPAGSLRPARSVRLAPPGSLRPARPVRFAPPGSLRPARPVWLTQEIRPSRTAGPRTSAAESSGRRSPCPIS
ncbi:hypothetical protein E3T28_07800 [Cryobacterium sinapicolor]|uniref:Uncharacterized protein n=1 Tax=Cryobacterium sinapicolor TaxID=1259236 RepID=A0ABY2JBI9_9MICO|nr:hypothetical protein E3T28_07800 [Cryobacterium sinapicolor]